MTNSHLRTIQELTDLAAQVRPSTPGAADAIEQLLDDYYEMWRDANPCRDRDAHSDDCECRWNTPRTDEDTAAFEAHADRPALYVRANA